MIFQCLASIITENQRKTVQMVTCNAMTFFVGQSKSFASCKCENNYTDFGTWDDYGDMGDKTGDSVSETVLALTSYDEEISGSPQRVVNIDLLDDKENPFKMVDSF
ncbi:hypothetical protein JCM33374_g4709 [Metschnikowia sp. JCM 33374]|nr:hypothetical protein JCM33374_g4709 [Metschnikowia sp. JCM 33374]